MFSRRNGTLKKIGIDLSCFSMECFLDEFGARKQMLKNLQKPPVEILDSS